ncbi:hypothetical protein CEXT_111261, partial [Caerostris extrusa]
ELQNLKSVKKWKNKRK